VCITLPCLNDEAAFDVDHVIKPIQDALVYELYGLSREQVRIVEEREER
jgi:hypothetical protein